MRKMITRVDPLYDAGMCEQTVDANQESECMCTVYRLLGDLAKAHMKRERLSTGLSHSKTIFPSCHVIWGSHYCLVLRSIGDCSNTEAFYLADEKWVEDSYFPVG